MNTLLADRVKNAPRSFTRKILDVIGHADIISFAGGLPDESLFPHELIKQEINHSLDTQPRSMYQYSQAQGACSLREELAQTYTNSNDKEILITTGSQQGLDILCKAFINAGDTIVVEAPSYLAALNLFALYDANIVEVNLTCKGVDTAELEEIFKTQKPKFFYAIPTFQNPTGWSWEEECKVEVARLAKKYNVLVIEDSPYNDLRYDGSKGISFEELLPELSVSLGTFSKTLVPDFRIGWMRANEAFLKVFQSMKENTDLQSPKFFQYIVANIIKEGNLALHVNTLIKSYKVKRDTMAQALSKEFGNAIEFELPKGGMFFWIKFNDSVDTMKLFDVAIQKNIAYVPGCVFYKTDTPTPYARLNFTNATLEDIEIGVKRLKEAYQEYIK
ncbi:PLP-dependent aminotransferase family protein [Sulfurospirillum arcachonense]|uniref:aminotransferase-like domain-containing protein n=1 Tax=Sulfurospirillum arcachonense TaxID=57666 RepID=UPI00046A6B34|nr:PLP-dependent aminotransferase family protein [Sulfurospirillum arcachonense]